MINAFLSTTNDLDTFSKILEQKKSKSKKCKKDDDVNGDFADYEIDQTIIDQNIIFWY